LVQPLQRGRRPGCCELLPAPKQRACMALAIPVRTVSHGLPSFSLGASPATSAQSAPASCHRTLCLSRQLLHGVSRHPWAAWAPSRLENGGSTCEPYDTSSGTSDSGQARKPPLLLLGVLWMSYILSACATCDRMLTACSRCVCVDIRGTVSAATSGWKRACRASTLDRWHCNGCGSW
jgi:hypothetical protein